MFYSKYGFDSSSVDSLKETPVVDSRGRYEMTLPQGTNIQQMDILE